MHNPQQLWRKVKRGDIPPKQWLGGVSHELIALPHSDRWNWRVSSARIDKACAFTSYPGVQRWLAVTEGVGLRLGFADLPTPVFLDPTQQPIRFHGETSCFAEPLGNSGAIAGETWDFNVFTLPGVRARVLRLRNQFERRIRVAQGRAFGVYSLSATSLIRCYEDPRDKHLSTECLSKTTQTQHELNIHELLWRTPCVVTGEISSVALTSEHALLFWIDIRPNLHPC